MTRDPRKKRMTSMELDVKVRRLIDEHRYAVAGRGGELPPMCAVVTKALTEYLGRRGLRA